MHLLKSKMRLAIKVCDHDGHLPLGWAAPSGARMQHVCVHEFGHQSPLVASSHGGHGTGPREESQYVRWKVPCVCMVKHALWL